MTKIILLRGGIEIAALNLQDGHEYFIGRDKSNDLVLENLSGISRKHAKISQSEDGFWKITNLSKSAPLVYEGESLDEIILKESLEFGINPYKFKSIIEASTPEPESEVFIAPPPPPELEDRVNEESAAQNTGSQSSTQSESGASLNDEKENDGDTAKHELVGTPYLKFISDDGSNDYLRLEGNLWTAGVDRTCEIILQDKSVNPQHFQIYRQIEGFFIKDLGSSYGTFINGNKIPEQSLYELNSGDLISVGNVHIQFEIRDTEFINKIKELPLQIYKNPMIFSDTEEILSLPPSDAWRGQEGYGQGAVPLKEEPPVVAKKKNALRTALIFGIILMMGGYFLFDTETKPKPTEDELKNKIVTFEDLPEAKRKMIVETYKLSQSLYHNAKFELALLQLNKIHDIIPSYKDSRELEKQCVLSRELLRETAQKEQERREREELKRKVDSIIAKCYEEFRDSMDLTGAGLCFEPAKEINPSDPRITEFLTEMQTRVEKDRQAAATLKEYQERIQQGLELFNKAVAFLKQKKYHEALDSFEEYLGSGLPDPDNNMEKSRKAMESIRKNIESQKNQYLVKARVLSNSKQWREAVLTAKRAQEIDPYDYSISIFIHSITTELHKEMKKIFLESLIEEGFGNIEAAKLKWTEILQKDVPTSDFYIKSSRKIEQYRY